MQTAVEYLISKIASKIDNEYWSNQQDITEYVEQAKEMEFRQRESDFIAGGKSAFNASQGKDFKTFEEYINS